MDTITVNRIIQDLLDLQSRFAGEARRLHQADPIATARTVGFLTRQCADLSATIGVVRRAAGIDPTSPLGRAVVTQETPDGGSRYVIMGGVIEAGHIVIHTAHCRATRKDGPCVCDYDPSCVEWDQVAP